MAWSVEVLLHYASGQMCVCHLPGEEACRGSMILRAMFHWEIWVPPTWTLLPTKCTTSLQQYSVSLACFSMIPGKVWGTWQRNKSWKCWLCFPSHFPELIVVQHLRDLLDKQVQSMEAPSQITGLKGSAAKILVSDTAAHFPRSCEVHASMGQSCSGGTNGICAMLGRWIYWY